MNDLRIVNQETDFPIKPQDIKTDSKTHLWGAFGKYETEVSAKLFVRAAQKKGSWQPLKIDDLNAEEPIGRYWFNGLIEDGLIVKLADDTYLPTIDFISRCYKAAPQTEPDNE